MRGQGASVYGLYEDASKAEEALDHLIAEEFASVDVSVVMRDSPSARVTSGTLGLLAGHDILSIPGTGPLIAAGPIWTWIIDRERGSDRIWSSLASLLVNLGIPVAAAQRFAERIAGGSVLLSIVCDTSERRLRAFEVLKSAGGEEIIAAVVEVGKPEGTLR